MIKLPVIDMPVFSVNTPVYPELRLNEAIDTFMFQLQFFADVPLNNTLSPF